MGASSDLRTQQSAHYTEAARATAIQLRDTSLATTVLVTGSRASLLAAVAQQAPLPEAPTAPSHAMPKSNFLTL